MNVEMFSFFDALRRF
uniref:Uncharacterized protein n=1 Tax=Rhizophora mucronata TaxID=61149 RepID=A0A2P2QQQ1_RHIMU